MFKWLKSIFKKWVLSLDVVKEHILDASLEASNSATESFKRSTTFNFTRLDHFITALDAQGVTLNGSTMAHVIRFAQVMGIPITAFDEFAQLARDKRAMYFHQLGYAQRLREQATAAEEEAADLRMTMNRLAKIAELGGVDPFPDK